MTIDLTQYAPVISDEQTGITIFKDIKNAICQDNTIVIDMTGIKSMATFCAKQIFGQLYKELGPNDFYSKIQIKNANDDIKVIIRMGIVSALEGLH